MRILIVNSFYYPEIKGGAEYSVKKLAEELQHQGDTVAVLTSHSSTVQEMVDNITVYRVKFAALYHSYGNVHKNPVSRIMHRVLDFYNPFNSELIEKVLNDFKPDIIHTNNLYEITPCIWKLAQKRDIPVVHTARDYYLMCYKTTLLRRNQSTCEKPRFLCKIYQSLYRWQTQYVQCLTAPSQKMIENISLQDMFSDANKQVIFNAIDFDADKVEANILNHIELLKTRKERVFVYLGGFHVHKGIKCLLEAFMNLRDVNARLIFAGKGAELDSILAATKVDPRISYAGMLGEAELTLCLSKCDVLVCPSIWDEPFGRVVLDAYKNGLPVIASRIGALPEIVVEGKTGTLVVPSDVNELTEVMQYFCSNEYAIKDLLGNLREYLNQFDVSFQAKQFKKIYHQLLNSEDTK